MIDFKPIRYFLFDFDGTLVDSNGLHAQAYLEALEKNHSELAKVFDYENFKGSGTREVFYRLGLTDAQVAQCVADKQQFYREMLMSGKLPVLPGAPDLLTTLTTSGATCCLVTSGSRRSVDLALTHSGLGKFLSYVVTIDDVSEGKPSAEPYLKALEWCNCIPHEAIVIEDALAGIISAKGAGLKTIGVHHPDIENQVDHYFSNLFLFKDAFLGKSKHSDQLCG